MNSMIERVMLSLLENALPIETAIDYAVFVPNVSGKTCEPKSWKLHGPFSVYNIKENSEQYYTVDDYLNEFCPSENNCIPNVKYFLKDQKQYQSYVQRIRQKQQWVWF